VGQCCEHTGDVDSALNLEPTATPDVTVIIPAYNSMPYVTPVRRIGVRRANARTGRIEIIAVGRRLD